MSFLKKLLGTRASREPVALDVDGGVAAPATGPGTPPLEEREPPIEAASIEDILCVEETATAEFFVGDLFRRRFGGAPPDYPRHFVAFYRAGRALYWPLGYVHYTAFEDTFLCGGMVMDDRLYRRIPGAHRQLIKQAGGVAERLLQETFARLAHAPAIWGYVGDRQAEAVDVRVGFRHTHHRHVMVVWNRDLPDAEKEARLARVIALGPF
ncbi:MAG: hypothetical protein ABI624_15930 [Casimicrobiaceae bacterium]